MILWRFPFRPHCGQERVRSGGRRLEVMNESYGLGLTDSLDDEYSVGDGTSPPAWVNDQSSRGVILGLDEYPLRFRTPRKYDFRS